MRQSLGLRSPAESPQSPAESSNETAVALIFFALFFIFITEVLQKFHRSSRTIPEVLKMRQRSIRSITEVLRKYVANARRTTEELHKFHRNVKGDIKIQKSMWKMWVQKSILKLQNPEWQL